MNALQPLLSLLEQTERERDAAEADTRAADAAERAAHAQAEQLVAYRSDYEQRWNAQFAREGRMELVRCYQGFMERLTQAVEQQARQATQAQARTERAREELRSRERRVASVRKLIEGRLREMRLLADRREQKQSDELAARIAWQGLPHNTFQATR